MTHIDPQLVRVSWDHTVSVRGRTLPLLSPDDCAGDEHGHESGGLVRLPALLLRFARRILFGRTAIDAFRSGVASVFAPEHRNIVSDMTGGEAMRLHAVYMALQERWYEALRAEASRTARGSVAVGSQSTASADSARSRHAHSLVWGRPLPAGFARERWGEPAASASGITEQPDPRGTRAAPVSEIHGRPHRRDACATGGSQGGEA